MEFGSIIQFLENKSVLVTGATGFLAKIFVEKILRVQPKVKKIYLLLRAADANTAHERLQNEIIGKDLFRVLKEKYGTNLNSIIKDKIVPLAGDVCLPDLGLKDSNFREEMMSELDVVLNFAATTDFNERYDIALGANTIGAMHALSFSQRCAKVNLLVHVSTAYVCGESSGFIRENSYRLGDTLNSASGLNIDEEKRIVEAKLNELRTGGATKQEIEETMRDLGMKRAKVYGWPNTYVFTKAMGEMVIGHFKGKFPAVIVRPTMVTSTCKEPFPGWLEGVKTIDALTVGYGKGRITCFLADETAVVDVIPADIVVNAIIVAMVAHYNRPSHLIYHVGSSVRNPITYANLHDYGYQYFTKEPWIGKDGKPVKVRRVKVLNSMDSFHRYLAIRYLLLLKGLKLVTTFCQHFEGMYNDLNRKINLVVGLVELYRPYLFFQGVFDDTNTENLRAAARKNLGVESDMFFFDPKYVNWDDYFLSAHGPGVVKYAFKR
ncbi:hypothetical protein K2173_013798 [Erythroxylum novogranatense]|uniref:Fatty acyl-CoA reductase n=1 Tax=Erythroxylum novogranatense TaxID=1862640 RepID=A0AAV8SCW7_9ROSI|nr:hypothetical protein K2173_013798 [Erythroxylum novogranatense]